MNMNREDLKALAEVGRALWADPQESQLATVETLSAVALLDLTPDRAIERAAAALLERVTHRGLAADTRATLTATSAGAAGASTHFFKLYPEERLMLVALHLGRWSYSRVSRVFNASPERIEEMAWSARVTLASSTPGVAYPSGAPIRGPHCPEYDPKRPWTQRFLDEEVTSGRERVFLQNHLMVCDSCRRALSRCRELYYAIDRSLPRLDETSEGELMIESLENIARKTAVLRSPVERSFLETLEIFFARWDVRFVLLLAGMVLGWRFFQ